MAANDQDGSGPQRRCEFCRGPMTDVFWYCIRCGAIGCTHCENQHRQQDGHKIKWTCDTLWARFWRWIGGK